MANGKYRKCPFSDCVLPDNNNKYVVQIFYLLASIALLGYDVSQFTFFSILMFTFPIVSDLASTDLESLFYNVVKWSFLVLNSLYVVFCIAGMGGFFVDTGDTFKVAKTAIIFPDESIAKVFLFRFLVADLIVPVMLYFACPTKKNLKVQSLAAKIGRS